MTAPHVSILTLHRAAASEAVAPGVAEHLESCGACRARLDSIHAATVQFADDPALPRRLAALVDAVNAPARRSATAIEARRPRARTWAWVGAGLTACAASFAIALGIRDGNRGTGAAGGAAAENVGDLGTRPKGSGQDAFEIIRRDGRGTIASLADSAQVRPDDAIRFAVKLARPGYIAVIGVDAAQAVTAYAPSGATLTAQAAGARDVLEGSIILDSVLGPERIALVVCDTPRAVDDILREARQALVRAGGNPRALGRISSCREIGRTIEKVQ